MTDDIHEYHYYISVCGRGGRSLVSSDEYDMFKRLYDLVTNTYEYYINDKLVSRDEFYNYVAKHIERKHKQ